MGGPANVERQHASGKLTVRERIDRLLDSGSFHEIGALAGQATYEDGQMRTFIPSNFVMGTGGGGSVKTLETMQRTYVPANPAWDLVVASMSEVPVIGACMGSVAGLGAVRVVSSH